MATPAAYPAHLSVPAEAQTPTTIQHDGGVLQPWRERAAERKRARLSSARSRGMLAQRLRRVASDAHDRDPIRRRYDVLLHYRVAAVDTYLLEIAAQLERAHDPDPACIAALRELLANGGSPPTTPASPQLRCARRWTTCAPGLPGARNRDRTRRAMAAPGPTIQRSHAAAPARRWSRASGLTHRGLLVAMLLVVAMAGFVIAYLLTGSNDRPPTPICSETCAPIKITVPRSAAPTSTGAHRRSLKVVTPTTTGAARVSTADVDPDRPRNVAFAKTPHAQQTPGDQEDPRSAPHRAARANGTPRNPTA
jgi:hypothetical protein